jgi:hypothetical protein
MYDSTLLYEKVSVAQCKNVNPEGFRFEPVVPLLTLFDSFVGKLTEN